MRSPQCPKCGRLSVTSMTQYGPRSQCCGLWSWDYAPLVDAETHAARKEAHEAFDPLWRMGLFTRSQAYRLLAERLGVSRKRCHMKLMDADTAKRVPPIAEQLLQEAQA